MLRLNLLFTRIKRLILRNREKAQIGGVILLFVLGGAGLLLGNSFAREKARESFKNLPKESPQPSPKPDSDEEQTTFGDLLPEAKSSPVVVKKVSPTPAPSLTPSPSPSPSPSPTAISSASLT